MSVHTFYRLAIWLPVVVPVLVALGVHGAGLDADRGVARKIAQVLLMSLAYGGLPYTIAAIAASFWIGGRPEREIRRLVLRSPLYVFAGWVPLVSYVAIRARSAAMFGGLLLYGAAAILLLGFVYIGLVLLLRSVLGRAGVIREGELRGFGLPH